MSIGLFVNLNITVNLCACLHIVRVSLFSCLIPVVMAICVIVCNEPGCDGGYLW